MIPHRYIFLFLALEAASIYHHPSNKISAPTNLFRFLSINVSQDRQVFGVSAISSQNRDNISLLGLGHSLTLFLGLQAMREDKGRSQADQGHLGRHLPEMRSLQGLQERETIIL